MRGLRVLSLLLILLSLPLFAATILPIPSTQAECTDVQAITVTNTTAEPTTTPIQYEELTLPDQIAFQTSLEKSNQPAPVSDTEFNATNIVAYDGETYHISPTTVEQCHVPQEYTTARTISTLSGLLSLLAGSVVFLLTLRQ